MTLHYQLSCPLLHQKEKDRVHTNGAKFQGKKIKQKSNSPSMHPVPIIFKCKLILRLILFCFLMHLGSFLHGDELLESIVHLLDGIVLGQAHAAFVGDVVDATLGLGVLSAGSADLQVVLSGGLFQLCAVGSQFGQLDVDRGADGGAQVGGAESQETEAVVVREGDAFLDLVDGGHQAVVDGLQVTTLLHGDDAEVILFVAPDQEGLLNVVVDTATSGPVAASIGSLSSNIEFHQSIRISLI